MNKVMNIIEKIWKRKRLLVLVLVIVGIGWFYYGRQQNQKNGYEEAVVQKGLVRQELVLTGEINALEYANLSFETSGKLAQVAVTEGQRVNKGALLGRLDTTTLYAAYQQAQYNLRNAEASLNNVYDKLQGHEADESFTQIETRTAAEVMRDNAYQALVIAQRNLAGATLYAPFSGIVTNIANPFNGMFVLASQPQFEVINPETIYFSVAADQAEVTSIKDGQKVQITLDSFPDKEIFGVVEKVDFAPDSSEVGVVYNVRVRMDDSGIDYRLGMTGDAVFALDQKDEALYVPSGFIKSDKEGQYLLLDKGAKKVYVELGLEGVEEVEIISDEIQEGQVIYD